MASATKTEPSAVDAGEAKGARPAELLQDKTPRRAGCVDTMEKFRGMNFVNGTLVQWPSIFSEMEVRGRVTAFSIEKGMLRMDAEGGNQFHCDVNAFTVKEKGGVFYLVGLYCPNPCAIAPEGVEIPKGPILEVITGRDEDGIEDSKRLLREGMGKASEAKPQKAEEDRKPTPSELADAFMVVKGLKDE